MNNEEKIIGILEKMQGQMDAMQEDISALKASQGAMQEDISALKASQGTMQEDISALKVSQDAMQETLTRVAITQENIVLPRIQLLAEGHATIMDMMPKKSRVESLEEDVAILKSAVEAHSLAIAELKAAR